MKAKADRIAKLSDALATLLEQEKSVCQEMISTLMESVMTIQGETADRRLKLLTAQLQSLQERFDLLTAMSCHDFLAKIRREADDLAQELADGRIASVLATVLEDHAQSLNLFCESLLDRLIEATSAERGFILFYIPESTEADVVAARNFQTRNLSLEEYSLSRTLLGQVLDNSTPLLIADASQDQSLSEETSIINLSLKSVLAVPLKTNGRTIGALYLENSSLASAFDELDQKLVEAVARFVLSYLDRSRLLPITFEQNGAVYLDSSRASKEIVGRDPKIGSLLEMINRLGDSPATVLIEGESGTGKELVARALHYQSLRRDHEFVAINCAAIPDNLLESELFGHEKGAFTGASDRYIGRIERGNGGTVFLDEISELAYPLQAKLLRFLQSSEVDRLGGSRTILVDARVVAATSKDLKAMVEAGRFQEALYYRLNVIPLRVPPLRERAGDIELLADHFLQKYSTIYRKKARADREVYELLKEHPFPGNVRELENLIHRLVALASDEVIHVEDLPEEISETASRRVSFYKNSLQRMFDTEPADAEELRRRKRRISRILAEQERKLAERVIEQSGGNLTEAARRLGVHRVTLYNLIKRDGEPDSKH
jgi:Nif-specific regulatory protein